MLANTFLLKKLEKSQVAELLSLVIFELEQLEEWNDDKIQELLNRLLEKTSQKPGILFQIIRISLTWAPFSPALNQTLRVIGKDESVKRLKNSLQEIEKM